jgi:hypothetical protein
VIGKRQQKRRSVYDCQFDGTIPPILGFFVQDLRRGRATYEKWAKDTACLASTYETGHEPAENVEKIPLASGGTPTKGSVMPADGSIPASSTTSDDSVNGPDQHGIEPGLDIAAKTVPLPGVSDDMAPPNQKIGTLETGHEPAENGNNTPLPSSCTPDKNSEMLADVDIHAPSTTSDVGHVCPPVAGSGAAACLTTAKAGDATEIAASTTINVGRIGSGVPPVTALAASTADDTSLPPATTSAGAGITGESSADPSRTTATSSTTDVEGNDSCLPQSTEKEAEESNSSVEKGPSGDSTEKACETADDTGKTDRSPQDVSLLESSTTTCNASSRKGILSLSQTMLQNRKVLASVHLPSNELHDAAASSLLPLDLSMKTVDRDCHCLFKALMVCMDTSELSHWDVRKQIVDYVLTHWDDPENQFSKIVRMDNERETPLSYQERMLGGRKDWGATQKSWQQHGFLARTLFFFTTFMATKLYNQHSYRHRI